MGIMCASLALVGCGDGVSGPAPSSSAGGDGRSDGDDAGDGQGSEGGDGGGTTETADGPPGAITGFTLTDHGDGSFTATASAEQPWTVMNLFRYASAGADDATGVLVASLHAPNDVFTIADAVPGWYAIGTGNINAHGTWWSHKTTRIHFGEQGAVPILANDDPRWLTLIAPSMPLGSSPTNGRYQIERQGDWNDMPTDAPGLAGAVHGALGVLHPDGYKSGGEPDSAYAFKLTTKNGKRVFYHRLGNGAWLYIGPNKTYRSEYGMYGGTIQNDVEYMAAVMMEFPRSFFRAPRPFLSFSDLHHEDAQSRYGGPGPFGVWGSADGVQFYWRLGRGGSWLSMATPYSFIPIQDRKYWWVFHWRMNWAAGNDTAFLHVYVAEDEGPLHQVVDVNEPWGCDSSPNTFFLKGGGFYGFPENPDVLAMPPEPENQLYERYSGGVFVVRNLASGTPVITPEILLATIRSHQ